MTSMISLSPVLSTPVWAITNDSQKTKFRYRKSGSARSWDKIIAFYIAGAERESLLCFLPVKLRKGIFGIVTIKKLLQ